MKVLMVPGKGEEGDKTTGISAVVHKYVEYLERDHGVDFVDKVRDADLVIGHAGVTKSICDVAIIHGLYWTGDYDANRGEYSANADIVTSVRSAQEITVPSKWVQKAFQRDMHISPTVIHHGIEWNEWQGSYKHESYILWNKNRPGDVCSPLPVTRLAGMFPQYSFISTFSHGKPPDNMRVIGKQPNDVMKELVQKSGLYLSLVKETFGIGILEAMASGVPVLGWDYGGNQVLVKHGVNGYLARIDDYGDLAAGLEYCIKNFKVLGANSRILAKNFSWDEPINKLYQVMERALDKKKRKNTTSFIIPVYNYAKSVGRAIKSVCEQTETPHEILVIDDGSLDNPEPEVNKIIAEYPKIKIKYVRKENGGVASARNLGVKLSTGKYICCLDADDAIAPDFLKTCTEYLEKDSATYTAYTRLLAIKPDGTQSISEWPGEYNYDQFLKRRNQVPTCNVSRREVWERLGGQRKKYSPVGAGSEDAELWLRAGAAGMGAKLVSEQPLFIYSWMTGLVSGSSSYQEVDWLQDHPWTWDEKHPFASHATAKYMSHRVFQYDLPKVSVIIPCAKGHEALLRDALDSLEAQTMRHWEVIVVYDNKTPIDEETKNAFPFIEWHHTGSKKGAAYARNLGVSHAQADVLFFLDADDTLMPTALERLYKAYTQKGGVIYSDYIILTHEDSEETAKNKYKDKFVKYNKREKLAYVKAQSLPYDCERAQRQPETIPYEWTTVSVMIDKALHNKIGGFDVELKTIEDVDYHWRLSHADACYTHIKEPLLFINIDSGTDKNKKVNHDKAIKTISEKYKGVRMSPCGGCGKSRAVVHPSIKQVEYNKAIQSGVLSMDDADFLLVSYESKNIGNHRVVGSATRIDYNYRKGGDTMLVHKDDIAISPHLFKVLEQKKEPREETSPPELLEKE